MVTVLWGSEVILLSGNLGEVLVTESGSEQKVLSPPAEVCGGRCPVDLNFVTSFDSDGGPSVMNLGGCWVEMTLGHSGSGDRNLLRLH